jgi:hypothetical protein
MSLSLGIRRVGRFYKPALRRWVRDQYFQLFGFITGVYTGYFIGRVYFLGDKIFYLAIGTYLGLMALRWWANEDAPTDHR